MAGAADLTPRSLYMEDFSDRTTVKGTTTTAHVLGAGTVTVTKVDFVSLSDLTSAASDVAAAAAGVSVGQLYYCSADGKVHARLS